MGSTGATIGWNNAMIDFNKKVKINGDLTLTGNLLESDGVTPRIFSNWTVATNPNNIYRGTGYVGIGTTRPETLLTVGSHVLTNGTRDLLRFPSYRHNEAFTIRNNDDDVTGRLEFFWGNT